MPDSPEQSRDRLSAEDRERLEKLSEVDDSYVEHARNGPTLRERALARAVLDIRREIQEQAHWATGRGCEACEPTGECGACGRPLDHEELPARIEALETRVRLMDEDNERSLAAISDDLETIGDRLGLKLWNRGTEAAPRPSAGDAVVELAHVAARLVEKSRRLDPESAKVLYDNLWDLYDDGAPVAPEGDGERPEDPVAAAIEWAARAHAGQVYRGYGGRPRRPYILHVLEVVAGVDTESERVVAALHDFLEDTDKGLPSWLTPEEDSAVRLLTRNEVYAEYISRLKIGKGLDSDIARAVKVADLRANLASSPPRRLRERYEAALNVLAPQPPQERESGERAGWCGECFDPTGCAGHGRCVYRSPEQPSPEVQEPQGDDEAESLLTEFQQAVVARMLMSTFSPRNIRDSREVRLESARAALLAALRRGREEQPAPATPSDSEKAAQVADKRTEEPRTLDELCEEEGALGTAAKALRRLRTFKYTRSLTDAENRALYDYLSRPASEGAQEPVALDRLARAESILRRQGDNWSADAVRDAAAHLCREPVVRPLEAGETPEDLLSESALIHAWQDSWRVDPMNKTPSRHFNEAVVAARVSVSAPPAPQGDEGVARLRVLVGGVWEPVCFCAEPSEGDARGYRSCARCGGLLSSGAPPVSQGKLLWYEDGRHICPVCGLCGRAPHIAYALHASGRPPHRAAGAARAMSETTVRHVCAPEPASSTESENDDA